MTKIKIATVIGARPQFIKASAFSNAIRDCQEQVFEEFIIHTGQHFDSNMSDVFFKDLEIPEPTYNLGIAGGGHGAMTGLCCNWRDFLYRKTKPYLGIRRYQFNASGRSGRLKNAYSWFMLKRG